MTFYGKCKVDDFQLGTMLLLASAAFAAGGLNAMAGGGTFFTLPALIFAGLPAVTANATSAAIVFPGNISAAIGFREALSHVSRRELISLLAIASGGSVVGSSLLLGTSDGLFRALAPYLLGLATALFYFGPRLSSLRKNTQRSAVFESCGLLLVSGYGGFFNGGLGIALLSVFSVAGRTDVNVMNGLKNAMSVALSLVSVVIFGVAGLINWPVAVAMMVMATVGGYSGAYLVQRVQPERVRLFVLATGMSMTVILFFS